MVNYEVYSVLYLLGGILLIAATPLVVVLLWQIAGRLRTLVDLQMLKIDDRESERHDV